jgi:hypothetical protein
VRDAVATITAPRTQEAEVITIETNAIVTPAGELTIRVSVPAQIQPGEHPVVLVIAEGTRLPAEPNGEFVVHQAGLTSPTNTLQRESLYGDDGR